MAWSEPVELMVLEDVSSFAELARAEYLVEFLRPEGVRIFNEMCVQGGRLRSVLSRRTPEDVRQGVEAVLPEQPNWTSRQMAARLSLPTDNGTLKMLGRLIPGTVRKRMQRTRGAGLYAAAFAPTGLAAVNAMLCTRKEWKIQDLAAKLAIAPTRGRLTVLGRQVTALGWRRTGTNGRKVGDQGTRKYLSPCASGKKN